MGVSIVVYGFLRILIQIPGLKSVGTETLSNKQVIDFSSRIRMRSSKVSVTIGISIDLPFIRTDEVFS